MKFFNNPYYAIVIVVFTAIIIDLSFQNWSKRHRVIEHDVHSYYYYLPAFFIYDDLKVEKDDYYLVEDKFYYFWNQSDENGNKVAKMTCGLSILYSPFFFIAHAIALVFNLEASGFSEVYKILLLISSIFYLLIGLIVTTKILKLLRFSSITIFISILLLGLGTNLLAYSSQSAVNSHVYSFCLFAGFIYNTIVWFKKPNLYRTILLGLLFGLITLIRPSNGLIVLFFIFYEISSFSDIKHRFLFFIRHFGKIIAIVGLTFVVWMPQFWYWNMISGNWIYYSYRNEGFYFSDPKIIEGLFSFRKGWLVYTPMMVFAIFGLFFLPENIKKLKWSILIFTIINIYVVFSWWCWWYGGTYGQRVMIESYALLIIPLAAFVKWVMDNKIIVKNLFFIICIFFIWLNIFQTYQFEYKALHYDSMSKKLYFKQFGKLTPIPDSDKDIDWVDYDKAKFRKRKL